MLIATTMGPSLSSSFSTSPSSTAASSLHSSHPQKGWSEQNLRPGERSAWTRGRDGWSGVEGSSGSVRWGFFFRISLRTFGFRFFGGGFVEMIERNKVLITFMYSSNLTFSLAPGWSFVESEDWRKDVQCTWSGCGMPVCFPLGLVFCFCGTDGYFFSPFSSRVFSRFFHSFLPPIFFCI